jgi:hypothetical protein
MGGKMKLIHQLNGEVISIGEWDYGLTAVYNPDPVSDEVAEEMRREGKDPVMLYDAQGHLVMEETNPYPEGATSEMGAVLIKDDGSRIAACDYKRLRQYPAITEQLDYIYHHGVEAWKANMIQPIKDAFPKG